MAEPARKRASYEELLQVPERFVAEIVGGELITHPRPAPLHALASSALGAQLGPPFSYGGEGPGGWRILNEPELHLADGDIAVPDLAGWRLERLPTLPEKPYFEQSPDWVCEVISPSTAARDRTDKVVIYAGAGVAHLWFIDPIVRTLEAYRLENGHWLLIASLRESACARIEPFEQIELNLARLWLGPLANRPQ